MTCPLPRLKTFAMLVGLIVTPLCSAQSNRLAPAIRSYAASHHFDGSVLVWKDGREAYRGQFGWADRAFDIPVSSDTVFRIGSITKTFTAVVVLQLAEEGKISLERPIRTYFPGYAGEGADRVSLEQLLHHTSGIRNLDAGLGSYAQARKTGIEHYQRPFAPDELVAKFCSGPLRHEPGRVFDYNNGEYLILGKIVERVAGQPFAAVIRARITGPLHLEHTGMAETEKIVKRLAPTYSTADGGLTFAADMPVYFENWFAAGAMYSTADDLMRFAQALFGGQLLRSSSLAHLLQPGLGGYGEGLWSSHVRLGGKDYLMAHRPGGIMGANASLRHYAGRGFSTRLDVIVLSNTNASDPGAFSRFIAETELGAPSPVSPAPRAPAPPAPR